MKNLKIILGIAILVIILGGAVAIILRSPKAATSPEITQPTESAKTYSMTEVALHNNAQNCWTTVSGKVYNLTSFTKEHPGGSQAILSLCGIDGTNAFLDEHSGQKRPETELQSLFIGTLK